MLFLLVGTKTVSYRDEVDRRRQKLCFSYWLEQKRLPTLGEVDRRRQKCCFSYWLGINRFPTLGEVDRRRQEPVIHIGWNKNWFPPLARALLTRGKSKFFFPTVGRSAGNLLIGFPSELLFFCKKKSE